VFPLRPMKATTLAILRLVQILGVVPALCLTSGCKSKGQAAGKAPEKAALLWTAEGPKLVAGPCNAAFGSCQFVSTATSNQQGVPEVNFTYFVKIAMPKVVNGKVGSPEPTDVPIELFVRKFKANEEAQEEVADRWKRSPATRGNYRAVGRYTISSFFPAALFPEAADSAKLAKLTDGLAESLK
jgi:hypothetical protein